MLLADSSSFCSGLGIFLSLAGRSETLLSLLARLCLLRVAACRTLGNASLVEEAQNAIGRLSALSDPVLDALFVQNDAVCILGEHRVPGAELFQKTAVARSAGVCQNDMVEGTLLGACASKPDLKSHCIFLSFQHVGRSHCRFEAQ